MPRVAQKVDKFCPKCAQRKPVSAFYASTCYSGGYSPYCKECHCQQNRQRWIDAPAKMQDLYSGYYQKHKDSRKDAVAKRVREYACEQKMANPAKWRAKRFFDGGRIDVDKDVTREFLENLFSDTHNCQCCGKRLALEYEPRDGRKFRSNPDSPSVDRVNNRKGYTRSNIAIICWECNFRKTDLTLEDLFMFEKYIRRFGNV